MTLFKKLLSLVKPQKIVNVDLDPDSVKTHNVINALAKENAELKGEKANYLIEVSKLKQSKEEKESDEEIKKNLIEQKKEIDKQHIPQFFSLKGFFTTLLNQKFKRKIKVVTFDRSTKLCNFGDIAFCSDGDFALINDEEKIIIKRRNLRDIFQSVGALGIDIPNYIIPINLDKNYTPVENFMVWEPAEIIPTKEGEFEYTKASKKPFYDTLNELRSEISEKNNAIEELEKTLTLLQRENDDKKRSERVSTDRVQTLQKEMSENEKSVTSLTKIFRATEKELIGLRDINVILEEEVTKLETQLTKMRKEAEREGSTASFDDAFQKIMSIKTLLREKTLTPASTSSSAKSESQGVGSE